LSWPQATTSPPVPGRAANARHRYNVSTEIELQVRIERHIGGGRRYRNEQQRITIGCRSGDEFGAEIGTCTRPVLDDDSLSVIAISENGGVIAAILGNPAMIAAYKEGVPGNGKPFPDGAKMAKIHWNPKKQQTYPGGPTVPGTQDDVDFW
jgi:hypothetical protein